tara:strand:- start:261 stop:476 length:216 start_codon:yes stop_codon:yes gene_type:complete
MASLASLALTQLRDVVVGEPLAPHFFPEGGANTSRTTSMLLQFPVIRLLPEPIVTLFSILWHLDYRVSAAT